MYIYIYTHTQKCVVELEAGPSLGGLCESWSKSCVKIGTGFSLVPPFFSVLGVCFKNK